MLNENVDLNEFSNLRNKLIEFEKENNPSIEEFEKNRLKLITKRKGYYGKNRDKILIHAKEYYKKNRFAVLVKRQRHYEQNKERKLSYCKAYYEQNKERIKKKVIQAYHENRKLYKLIGDTGLFQEFLSNKYNGSTIQRLEEQKGARFLLKNFKGKITIGKENKIVLPKNFKKPKVQPPYENKGPISMRECGSHSTG